MPWHPVGCPCGECDLRRREMLAQLSGNRWWGAIARDAALAFQVPPLSARWADADDAEFARAYRAWIAGGDDA